VDIVFPPPRASAEDIATHLRVDSQPLNLLHVVNAKAGESWHFEISLSAEQELILDISIPSSVSPFSLLDGTYPELLWCDSLFISADNSLFKIDDPTNDMKLELASWSSDFPQNGLRLVNYQRTGKLAPDFLNVDNLRSVLVEATWLGSRKYIKCKSAITLKVVANKYCFTSESVTTAESSNGTFSRVISNGPRIIQISYPGSSKGVCCRIDKLGIMRDADVLTPILNAVKSPELKSFDVELQGDWPFETGPLGGRLQTERLELIVDEFAVKVKLDKDLRNQIKKLRDAEVERQAEVLNTRVSYAKASEVVYWKDHVVGCVPQSELATVALISKLEGMDALPFARYDSLAWASHEGIDAIVDLQFKPNDALMSFVPVEYEFFFANFIIHGHPIQHAKLIICWDDNNDGRLTDGSEPWLRNYTVGGVTAPVLILRRLPGITVRKPTYGVKNG